MPRIPGWEGGVVVERSRIIVGGGGGGGGGGDAVYRSLEEARGHRIMLRGET